MKTLIILAIASSIACAEPFSATYRYGEARRLAYTLEHPNGFWSDDSYPKGMLVNISIPDLATGKVAITLIHDDVSKASGRKDETYEGLVVNKHQDMLAIIVKFSNTKMEYYTIYPNHGAAFLTVTSHYLGFDWYKSKEADNPKVEFASTTTVQLIDIKKK